MDMPSSIARTSRKQRRRCTDSVQVPSWALDGSRDNSGKPNLPAPNNKDSRVVIPKDFRDRISKHIRQHRVTFLQGEPGCGKSTSIPQLILDDADARGEGGGVRVIVAQPKRIAAISLANYVAKLRGGSVGEDVGYAVGHEHSFSAQTRLTYVTNGYLLEWLGHMQHAGRRTITHIFLDEVHVRSVDHDLLLLMLKLLMAGIGRESSSLQSTKLVIMSATMEVGPLQDYFQCLIGTRLTKEDRCLDPISLGRGRLPVDVVHIEEMTGYLPNLPNPVADLAKRLANFSRSGTGERALDGTCFPRFAIDLVTGLVRHVGRAGDSILVFVASLADIVELQQALERSVKENVVPLDVVFLHSILTKQEQEMAIAPSPATLLKVILATNVAESSLTIPNVRVVIDLGNEYQHKSGGVNECPTATRVWCSKASSRQRAGRAGRLFPGVVFRLFTRETFERFLDHEMPEIALQNLGSTVLRVKSLFQYFPTFSVGELLEQLLDSPPSEDLTSSLASLQKLGAITKTTSDFELTRLGRLATQLTSDISLARFVFCGLLMGCGVDCVVMAAGISIREDIFLQPLLKQGRMDPLQLQDRKIANARQRMQFDRDYYSELLVYCHVYIDWTQACINKQSTYQWIKRSELQLARFSLFLLAVRDFALKTVTFLIRESLHQCLPLEVRKLVTLGSINPSCPADRRYCRTLFCENVALVHTAIAAAFSKNILIGLIPKQLVAKEEIRELVEANMPTHLSFKLRDVPPNLAAGDILRLEKVLKILAPFTTCRILASGERTVLVHCLPLAGMITSPGVIYNLPDLPRLASYMAKSSNGNLIFFSKEDPSPDPEVAELNVGRPSENRNIRWTRQVGKELRKVQFNRFSLISTAVETRQEVSFHIAVAANILNLSDSSVALATHVTVLPPHISVLLLLMFRAPQEELHIRVHSKSDRIYSVKCESIALDLAPRFIRKATLKQADRLRSRIEGLMAGNFDMEHGYLKGDMLQLFQYVFAGDNGPAVLAPEIGPWVKYPSLEPVNDNAKKLSKPKDFCQLVKNPVKENYQEKHPKAKDGCYNPGSTLVENGANSGSSQDLRHSPLLVQSRSDVENFYKNVHVTGSLTSKKSLNVEVSLEEAFSALELPMDKDKRQFLQWIQGDRTHNGMCFELLKELVHRCGEVGQLVSHTKVVLEYVYTRRHELVNKKQKSELEGWYHSICNLDQADTGFPGAVTTKDGQTVEVHRHSPQARNEAVERLDANEADGSIITRHVELAQHERSLLISALDCQKAAAKITVGALSAHRKTGLAIVSGKADDVERAMQLIESIIHVQPLQRWESDETYIDLNNVEGKVRCVEVDVWEHKTYVESTPVTGVLQFVLVEDSCKKVTDIYDHAYPSQLVSLYHGRMKNVFDKALKDLELGPGHTAQLQARLGRVIFTCPSFMKNDLPFLDGQGKPLGKLRPAFDRHRIRKKHFNDSIPEKDFFHLRVCLHLCHPKAVERHQNIILVVLKGTAAEQEGHKLREEKLEIVDSLEAPGKFHLKRMERKRRLATVDIVRLHAGAIEADVRLSMQGTQETLVSQEAYDYVSKITRRGSKLEFPTGPYVVQCQRHKESEYFQFEGLKVCLTAVKQIRRTVCRSKYEVEFEATGLDSCSKDGQWLHEITVPMNLLTSRIPFILQHVQNVCSRMCWLGPCNTVTGLAHALLRSWTKDHDEGRLKDILISELAPRSFKGKAIAEDHEKISSLICSLVETLSLSDGRILKEGMDVAGRLQLVVLRIIRSMNILLSNSLEDRVKCLLTDHIMEPENALYYACLLKCHCSRIDWTWETVLQPYLMQLLVEERTDIIQEVSPYLKINSEFSDCSPVQFLNAITRCSIWTTLSALARTFQEDRISSFLNLFNVMVRREEGSGKPTSLVRHFVGDLLSYHGWKAASFVCRCVKLTVGNESSIIDVNTCVQNVMWLVELIRVLDIFVDEDCRQQVLELLLKLPPAMERKRELEELMLDIYGVDEAQFRNLHYQRILQHLGRLRRTHREELKRRGLGEKQISNFNFRSWAPGKVVISSSLIPGVNKGGHSLAGSPGIFIPARDPFGHILGGQIKVDDNSTGKYKWLSSNKIFDGAKGPRTGGDMPLFCCVPKEVNTSIVGLCEGGLKAHVLAALSGLPVIGASGADFCQSKHLLERYLAMMDVEQIVFFPDAGSQCNDQVIRSYYRTFRLLRDWSYHVFVAWWGQVNKTEYDDIDDYLMKRSCVTEFPLISISAFWKLLHPDVRSKLQIEFPEYEKRQVHATQTNSDLETFTDQDRIRIHFAQDPAFGRCYQITIPKDVMAKMPEAPNDYVTPSSVPNFTIEVLVVHMDDLVGVDAAIDWLLPQLQKPSILGLDCEHGLNGDLSLLQLSTHQRCVLIRITNRCLHPRKLAKILLDKRMVKTGAEVQNDALALYDAMGLMVNGLRNMSQVHKTQKGTKGILEIFRNLYGWEFTMNKDIARSDWNCPALCLEQVKYAALVAWASRMIAFGESAALKRIPLTSLEDLPQELLNLFGRAIRSFNVLKRSAKTVFETSGTISEGTRCTLRLVQDNFASRIMGTRSHVQLRFKDGQEPVHFQTKCRTGKSVVLAPMAQKRVDPSSAESTERTLPIDISSVSSIIVDNSNHHNWQDQRLRDAFYNLLCQPDRSPEHLLRALRCEMHGPKSQLRAAFPKKSSQLTERPFTTIWRSLNESQREALHQILTSPLSATIGPPGTGKTRLISALCRTWVDARGEKEVLLCTAHQNVAARHLVETLADDSVQGVLLLISADYFVDWHERFYEKLSKAVVVTKSPDELPGALEDWRRRNKRSTVSILVCTLALVGCPEFVASLMGGKVSAMVIDECSQAADGSCIHPLMCLPDLTLLTVLGDPNQLPPFGSSEFNKVPSIFDLVSNGCQVKLLKEQYRMPPSICEFLSSELYQNILKTAPARHREKDWQHPLLWVDIRGVTSNNPGNPSKYNTMEAEAVFRFCQAIMRHSYDKGVTVLTLYDEQKRRISNLLGTHKLHEQVTVHNVDSFQGQQSDIVLISLVAGKQFSSFAADRHRACVMLSRAKRFLCVFGNHEEVRWNEKAQVWKSLAGLCEARGLVVEQEHTESMLSANLRQDTN